MRRLFPLLAVLGALGCAKKGPSPELLAVARAADTTPADALALGQALQAAHLDAASLGPLRSAGGAPGPAQAAAVEALLAAQEGLDEQLLVPAFLAGHPDAQPTSPGRQERALLLRGLEAQRQGALEQAESNLRRIPATSPLAPRARYALGIVLSDPRRPGGPRMRAALDELQAVLGYGGGGRERAETRALAQLGIARLLYGLGQDAASAAAYDRVPRDARVWPESLFERGYPRFRAGDDGGALGTVHATRAPQLRNAFLPEARILEATVLFHACLYLETRNVLDGFSASYRPLSERLQGLVDRRPSAAEEVALLADPAQRASLGEGLGGSLVAESRIDAGLRLLRALEEERAQLAVAGGGGPALEQLERVRAEAEQATAQAIHARLADVSASLRDLLEQADVLRFEMTKGEKELLDADLDQRKLLAARPLPPLPTGGPADERWRVDGEWWSDEIGHERATLKDGCPAQKSTPSVR
ncbi:MAG TPA: hypothetical protein VLT82_14440 [Myxococcaceae bacterium]|nr:hypothetical protein [Myxococcaceae bacterium]